MYFMSEPQRETVDRYKAIMHPINAARPTGVSVPDMNLAVRSINATTEICVDDTKLWDNPQEWHSTESLEIFAAGLLQTLFV